MINYVFSIFVTIIPGTSNNHYDLSMLYSIYPRGTPPQTPWIFWTPALYYPKMSAFSFQNFVVLLYLFLRNGTWKEYIPFSVHKNVKTFNKMSEKRSLGQSVLERNRCMCGSSHVLCYGQSIICLPCMVRTSFMLVVLTKLNVSEL